MYMYGSGRPWLLNFKSRKANKQDQCTGVLQLLQSLTKSPSNTLWLHPRPRCKASRDLKNNACAESIIHDYCTSPATRFNCTPNLVAKHQGRENNACADSIMHSYCGLQATDYLHPQPRCRFQGSLKKSAWWCLTKPTTLTMWVCNCEFQYVCIVSWRWITYYRWMKSQLKLRWNRSCEDRVN